MISLKQSRVAGTVLQQFDFSCGSAAVATLLTHHNGVPVTEQTVLQEMYAVGNQTKIQKEGFSLLDMMHYLAGLVFTADSFKQPLDKLIEARVAAVALVNEAGCHHFVVIKGLDATRVLVGDQAKGIRALSRAQFDSIWIDGLLFVIYNRMGQARFNQRSEGEDWLAMSDSQLDEMRGGFSVQPGVMVSFGIMRTVQRNGVLVSSSGFQITDLRSITGAQAERLSKQTAGVSLVHNGAGNTFTTPFQAGIPAVVVQNTLNVQPIQSVTEINAVSSGQSILKGINLNQTLNDALGAARRWVACDPTRCDTAASPRPAVSGWLAGSRGARARQARRPLPAPVR